MPVIGDYKRNMSSDVSINESEYSDASPSPRRDSYSSGMTMSESIALLERAVEHFFHNNFSEAEHMGLDHPEFKENPYLVALPAYVRCLFAIITMDKESVDAGLARSKAMLDLASKYRRATGITGWFFKPDFSAYTDEEAHMEVLIGEANFINVVCTFLSDPNIFSLVKAVLKLRACYNAYYTCGQILRDKESWQSEDLRKQFEAGYKLGWGFYNMILSHLPTRVLKILAFVGFESDRAVAREFCFDITITNLDTYRSKIASFLFCFYSFYLEQFFGCGTAELDWVKQITDRELRTYPNSSFDLFFAARSAQLSGDMHSAIRLFNQCIQSQDECVEIHAVCTWDLLWSHAMILEWETAARYADQLVQTCNWSKSTNLYQHACFRYMLLEQEGRTGDTAAVSGIMDLLKRVPDYKKRFAGRTIPPEKFAITKAKEYSSGQKELVLPALELFYIWNIYGSAARRPELLNPFLDMIEDKMLVLEGASEQYFTLMLIKGVCLRNQGQEEAAVACFTHILDRESGIKELTYIPPHAAFELGLTLLNRPDQLTEAKYWLERARDHYTGFLVESLVHLRIHGALSKLREIKTSAANGSSSNFNNNSKQGHRLPMNGSPDSPLTLPDVVEQEEEVMDIRL